MRTESMQDRVVPTTPRRWKSVRLGLYVYAALILVVFLGSIQIAQMAGFWSTSGKVTATGEKIQATGADPAEIKGWMTLSEVITAYKVPQADLYAQFKLPGDLAVDTPLNQIEKLVAGFSVGAVRDWLKTRQAP